MHLRPLGAPMPDPESPGDPRVDYDVPHGKPWGIDMVLYLLIKAISTGAMLLGACCGCSAIERPLVTLAAPVDLARLRHADRRRARHRSRAAGALLLHPHAPELAIVDGRGARLPDGARRGQRGVAGRWLVRVDGAARAGSRCRRLSSRSWRPAYTGFLFAQGLGRDLWQGPHAAIDLRRAVGGRRRGASLLLAASCSAVGGGYGPRCWR